MYAYVCLIYAYIDPSNHPNVDKSMAYMEYLGLINVDHFHPEIFEP